MDALTYYQSIEENLNDEATINMAMEIYFNEEYRNFFHDYNHIIATHSEHLEEIHEQLGKCEVLNCKMATRYSNDTRRRQHKNQSKDIDTNYKLAFYLELVDIIHFWLYHQYDVGMRIKNSAYDDNKDNEIQNHEDGYFDAAFAKMQKEIITRRDKLKSTRFNQNNDGNKYTMHVNDNTRKSNNNDKEQPFMEIFSMHLREEHISVDIIDELLNFIKNEHYDTDALIEDISDYHKGSNIINKIRNQHFIDFIEEYARDLSSM